MPNEKRRFTYNISVSKKTLKNPKFIKIGEERIRLSNIVEYSLFEDNAYYVKVQEEEDVYWGKFCVYSQSVWKGELLPLLYKPKDNRIYFFDEKRCEYCWTKNWIYRAPSGQVTEYDMRRKGYEDIVVKQGRALRIRTSNNNTYEYWSHIVDFDIYEKCKELDRYMMISKNLKS